VSRVQVRIAVLPPAVDRTLRFFSGSHEPFERHIVMAVNGVPASCPHRLPDWRRPLLREGEGAGVQQRRAGWLLARQRDPS
jgi:hypothetical protein